MPIEIKELHIKAVVQDDCSPKDVPSATPAANNTDSIVERCVEQVLNILKEKKER